MSGWGPGAAFFAIIFTSSPMATICGGTDLDGKWIIQSMSEMEKVAASLSAHLSLQLAGASAEDDILASWLAATTGPPFAFSGRQLTSSQTASCTFTNGMCTPSISSMESIVSSAGNGTTTKMLMEKCVVCAKKTTEATCKSETKCAWEATKNECTCVPDNTQLQALMTNMMGSPTQCGWIGKMMEAIQCTQKTATDCTNDAKCKLTAQFQVPAGATSGSCTQKQVCDADIEKVMNSMCGAGFDMTAVTIKCVGSAFLGTAAAINCFKKECVFFGDMMEAMLADKDTCEARNTTSTCKADSKCKWESNKCEVNSESAMMKSIPDECPFKAILAPLRKCEEITTSATCTGDCMWENQMECNEANNQVTASSKCEVKPSIISMQIASTSCNDDAILMAKLFAILDSCASATASSACSNITVPSVECKTNDAVVSSTVNIPSSVVDGIIVLAVVVGFFLPFTM